jgi:putative monooxygenase
VSARGGVLSPSRLPRVERGGGARTTPLVTRGRGATAMLNGITEFAPGAAIPMHSHNCEESVLVLDGEFTVVIDGAEHRAVADDTSFIPAGVPHRFINASGTAPGRIFWTYASVDATRTMTATGEEHPVAAEHDRPPEAESPR